MANRETEFAQAKGVEEHLHLMPHPHAAVLQIAVIKAKSRIDEYLLHSRFSREFHLSGKVVIHQQNWIFSEAEIADIPDILSLDVADDDSSIVGRDQVINLIQRDAAGEIHDRRT